MLYRRLYVVDACPLRTTDGFGQLVVGYEHAFNCVFAMILSTPSNHTRFLSRADFKSELPATFDDPNLQLSTRSAPNDRL